MQIPDKLTIFGRDYFISDVSHFQSAEGILGQAAFKDGVIYLDENLDMALSLSTLWHEAVHIAQQEILGTTDEAQARWVSLFVHNFLLNNPDVLLCYLREGCRCSDDDEAQDEHEGDEAFLTLKTRKG
ncbi:hypothetical protein ACFL2Q_08160 [Thermodesulfobacteriota bacterium]